MPVIQHETWGEMEIWIAGRYAEIYTYGEIGQPGDVTFTTTIPKFSMRYSPTEWVAIRASLTEGFVTPGLYALFGEPGQYGGQRASGTSSQATIGDYICDELPELVVTEECTQAGQNAVATNVLYFWWPKQRPRCRILGSLERGRFIQFTRWRHGYRRRLHECGI